MKNLLLTTAALAALSVTTSARADEAGPAPTPDVAGALSELVVTATRSPQAADRIGQSVTVIGAQAIAASQAVAVSDLLSRSPGVAYSRNGGAGGVTALRIRGAESDQTVVIVDGVKLNDPSAPGGGYNFGNLMIGDIARLEILRGAQSTLWGSQAIGGVVNIVTTEPVGPLSGSALLEGGADKTLYARAAVGAGGERLIWRLAGGRYTTDGVSSYRLGKEADGYTNTQLSGRARLNLTPAASLDVRAVLTKGRKDFDGFPSPAFVFADTAEYGRTEDLVVYAGLNHGAPDSALKSRLGYGFTRTDSTNYDPSQSRTPFTFDASGENRRAEYQGVWALSDRLTATFGVESETARLRTATSPAVQARAKARIDGAYVQVQATAVAGLTLTGGLRHDSHDTFGDHTLGQLAAAWSLQGGKTVVRASFGQGFKAPSLYQLYGPYGNLGLSPEEADGWDAGVEHRLLGGEAVISATLFGRETENQIDFVSCVSGSRVPLCRVNGGRFGYYDNVARARAKGIETSASASFGALSFDANYTWTDTENAAPGPNRGKQLARRPQHQANFQLAYDWPIGVSTAAAIRYVGESFDSAANTYRLQAYTVVDLRAVYQASDKVEVYGRIENLFDDSYETVRNYGSPGRGAFVGVRARF